MRTRSLLAVSASLSLAALAGCATGVEREAYTDPYAAAVYTGAPRPDAGDLYAGLNAPIQTSSNGAPFELVSYEGIEGARRAHALYVQNEAEALDGRCEAEVRPTLSESMIDIADLCDVPLEILVEYNPGIADISYATDGGKVRIPGGIEAPQGAFAMSDQLAQLDAVQPGDSLESIAYRLNISAAALATLNPNIDWTKPTPGQAFVKPVAASAATSASPAHSPEAPPAWEGYSSLANAGEGGGGVASVTPHAPYIQGPVRTYARAEGVYPEPKLSVDKRYVAPGERVNVTASNLKEGTRVVFSGGSRDVSATADSEGNASADIRVSRKATTGNFVITGRPVGSKDTLFSETVGVVALKEKSSKKDKDEDDDNDSDDDESED